MKKKRIFFKDVQIRASESEDKRVIEGVIPYNSKSVPIWGVIETIDQGAFRKTLDSKKNIFALFNHDDSKILGSTRAETLTLENTGEGLKCRCTLPATSWGNDAWEVIKRGDGNTMSFGFDPVKWKDNGKERALLEVELHEVSFCVPFAAYPETGSKILRRLKRMNVDLEAISGILEKDQPSEEDIAVLKEFVDTVNAFIEKNKTDEGEAGEAGHEDTPGESSRNADGKGGEEIKQEIIGLIDLLLEMNKLETSSEDEESGE